MKIAVVGSCSISNYDLCREFINSCYNINAEKDIIITGDTKGVDDCAIYYAKSNNIKYKVFNKDYVKYGDKAKDINNMNIIKYCDECICIWDGESIGTKYDIELCKNLNKKCYIYNVKLKLMSLI